MVSNCLSHCLSHRTGVHHTGDFRSTVLHTNDMHAHYKETCHGATEGGSPCGAAGGIDGFAGSRHRTGPSGLGRRASRLSVRRRPFHVVLQNSPLEHAADFSRDLGIDVMVRVHLTLHFMCNITWFDQSVISGLKYTVRFPDSIHFIRISAQISRPGFRIRSV